MKHIRVLVYEGSEEWINKTLAGSLRASETLDLGMGKITVLDITDKTDLEIDGRHFQEVS